MIYKCQLEFVISQRIGSQIMMDFWTIVLAAVLYEAHENRGVRPALMTNPTTLNWISERAPLSTSLQTPLNACVWHSFVHLLIYAYSFILASLNFNNDISAIRIYQFWLHRSTVHTTILWNLCFFALLDSNCASCYVLYLVLPNLQV